MMTEMNNALTAAQDYDATEVIRERMTRKWFADAEKIAGEAPVNSYVYTWPGCTDGRECPWVFSVHFVTELAALRYFYSVRHHAHARVIRPGWHGSTYWEVTNWNDAA